MSDVGEVAALRHSLTVTGVSARARLLLAIMETVALGGLEAHTLLSLHRLVGGSMRKFRLAVHNLRDAGFLAVRDDGHVVLRLGDLDASFEPLPSAVIDDPWQVIRAKVFATKGSQCHYCGADASQVDHVLPRSRGGLDVLDNLVPACALCNHAKGDMTPEEWFI